MNITLNLESLSEKGLIHSSWVQPLQPVQEKLTEIGHKLSQFSEQGMTILPELEKLMRAFTIPFQDVKVVILGQDPYPTPGDAVGLAFSVAKDHQIPRSLNNIFTELVSDIGCEKPQSGDLSPWATQGVMLLNRVLSVESGQAGSHRGNGWEDVTEQALRALNSRENTPLVAVLWGNDAISAKRYLTGALIIESPHPSPLSASRGFFGSRPFSRVNDELKQLGYAPINWALPSYSALF
jgi:uracil-DNA glycosylase